MFKTKDAAAEFAREYSSFLDTIWNPKTEWTEALFDGRNAKDMLHVFQGQACEGISAALKHWNPMKGAFVQHQTLGVDLETHTENMVVYKHYGLFKTFEGKDMFGVARWIVNVNNDGLVTREVAVMDQKYHNAMMAVMGAFAEKNGIKM